MGRHHLVRVGAMAQIGRFASIDSVIYPRGSRVVLRTRRGLEVGQVLTPPASDDDHEQADGAILRGVTTEDELLQARLEKNRLAAYEACVGLLRERNLQATLLDVEQLFDGERLFFYFLGDTTDEVEALTAELAEAYEAQAQTRKFAELLLEGCGPGCGTEAAEGNGCGSCTTCAVAGACATKKR